LKIWVIGNQGANFWVWACYTFSSFGLNHIVKLYSHYILNKNQNQGRNFILELKLETIGQRLRALRVAHNLTIPDVNQKTGISKGNLSAIETDKNNPSANALMQLAVLYGVTTDWILFGEKINLEKGISVSLSSLELANIFSRINEVWEQGDERIRGWVIIQLENAFPKVAEQIKKEKQK
jgi:transcriptional regulator with XRE-family HTH domain